MAIRQVRRSRRNKTVPEHRQGPSDADDALRALAELFSDPKLKHKAQFRYPVDGQKSESERIVDEAIEAAFGPDKEHERWAQRLHQFGLIPNPKAEG